MKELNDWLGNIENRKMVAAITVAAMPAVLYFGNLIYYRIVSRIFYRRLKRSLETMMLSDAEITHLKEAAEKWISVNG